MKIRYDGKYVILDDVREWEDMQALACSCEHSLKEHEVAGLVGSTKSFEVGGCHSCGCKQFRIMKGRFRAGKFSYA